MQHHLFTCFVGFLCSVAIGCGGAKSKNERVYPVSGRVTYNGQPVKAADVTFFNAEKNKSAFGRTDDQGKFKLTTFVSNDGAVAGKNVVTVTKIETTAPPKPLPATTDRAYEPPKFNESTDPAPPKNAIPAKYSDVKTTDLIAVVNDKGANPEMNLELKD